MARAGDGLDFVVDSASPQRGGGQIWLLGPVTGYGGERSLIDFLSWEAPTWTERRPLSWSLVAPLDGAGKHTLIVICAPQVRLQADFRSPTACSGCHYPAWWQSYLDRVQLEIIRVLGPEEVPQPGERVDYGALLYTRYVDHANQAVDDPSSIANPKVLISVTRTKLGIKITDGSDDWSVSVEALNPFEPSLVDFGLRSGMPLQPWSLSQTDIVVRRTNNTKVDGFQRYADQENEIASFHQVTVFDEKSRPADMPPERTGALPQRGNEAKAVPIPQRPMPLTAIMSAQGQILLLAFSLFPVIGEAIDIAELLSIVLRRTDLQGDAAGSGQFALTAASLMTGPILEGPENARRIGKVLETLSPIRYLDATGVVSLAVKREMLDQVSPLQKAATKALAEADEAKIVGAIESAAAKAAYEMADDAIEATIRATMDRMASSQGLPVPLVNDVMREVHPGELSEEFATLSDDAARGIVDLYGAGARADFDFDLAEMARRDAAFWAEYAQTVDEAAVFRLFTPLGDDFVHPQLRQGFRDYKAGGGGRNAIQWLANQSGRSRYRRVLTDNLGNDGNRIVAQVMGRTVRRRGYRPSAQEIDDGVRAMDALESRLPGKLADVLPYGDAAEFQRGFGHLLERDHLLEGRFWRHYVDGAIDREDFWCVFAPKNAFVRDELAKRGWAHFDYDHVTKTQRMRQLIPHGNEDAFTTAEIYMAHWLAIVDVHTDLAAQVRAAERFDAVVMPLLREMAKSKGEGVFVAPNMMASQMLAVLAQRRATL